jgi:hypothetical protein
MDACSMRTAVTWPEGGARKPSLVAFISFAAYNGNREEFEGAVGLHDGLAEHEEGSVHWWRRFVLPCAVVQFQKAGLDSGRLLLAEEEGGNVESEWTNSTSCECCMTP